MTPDTIREYYQPAEWAPHEAVWTAWPSHGELWQENLKAAQTEFVGLCKAISDVDPQSGKPRGERLEILVPDETSWHEAQDALKGLPVRFHRIPFGDIWLRDTAPLFLLNKEGKRASVRFAFNGWGGKYVLPYDAQVSEHIASKVSALEFSYPWILEGGSVDVDGEGTCLTTRQCLLNSNRNAGMKQSEIESGLCEALGVTKVLWLNDGLINDHTDGHVDTIARFVKPGVVVCMQAMNPTEDPNHRVLEEIAHDLSTFTDAKGRSMKVVRIPSPGKILSEEGRVVPASYVNFYIGNSTVVVPTYGSPYDEQAVREIAELFPTRRTVGSRASAILSGGGAFHCITQQQPAEGLSHG